MTPFSSIVIGNESLLVQCSEQLLARGNTITAVVTANPDIADWARDKGLRAVAPGTGLADRLAPHAADWLLSIANLSIIPPEVLALARRGAINFHDGPLPRHAGLNAPVWALIEGERRHGITWHMIEGGIDEGDLLVTRGFDIDSSDTALTLNAKAYAAAIESFPDLLDQLEQGHLRRVKQDLGARSYHGLSDRPEAHGLLRFDRPAADLERLVRALDHGAYWNPLALPKMMTDGRIVLIGAARIVAAHAAPGTVISVDADTVTIACADRAIALSGLRDITGQALSGTDLAIPGRRLDQPDDATFARLGTRKAQVAPHVTWWRHRLADLHPATFSLPEHRSNPQIDSRAVELPGGDAGLGGFALWAARLVGRDAFDIAVHDPVLQDLSQGGLVMPWAPVRVRTDGTLADIGAALDAALQERARRVGFACDLPLRAPELSVPRVPDIGLSMGAGHVPGTALTVDVQAGTLSFDAARIMPEQAALLAARLEMLAHAPGHARAGDMPRLPDAERDAVLLRWNDSARDHDRRLTMHRAFEAQVARTPDAVALICEGDSLSYASLNARANRAAHVLRDMGVAPGQVVGLCCPRSVDLVVGALAILKAGGAYLPMDPTYPADRLAHFVSDSAAPVIVTRAGQVDSLPPHEAQVLALDTDPRVQAAPGDNLPDTAAPDDLAYLIYTSGSTGRPKGVMVEHRNVINFYAGMDAVVDHEQGGTWLAVTSLSFDISVLELFYTTARGFTVVLTGDENRAMISNGPLRTGGEGMQFSIYYWGNDDGAGRDKYRLLLDGARFADENGFVAVWTPERHFHAFGGPYPNPSVTGAAVAAVTRNIGVRAGSVVAPLHHPARIAEEWAVIDNLTNGRAGLAIASGWQPDDFILRPENTPPANKPAMAENIDQIRALWRGEAVAFPRANGDMHEVVTQPRPVSREVPIWVTTAGNPQTWQEAGQKGCNVLTHLLGQSIDEVGEKIALYHAALRDAGHDPADFTVTLMLHTFLSDSRDHAREIARGPMKEYLRSAAGLIKQYAWVFPAFKRPQGVDNAFDLSLDGLTEDEMDAILDFAFERYFNESGLFGTVSDALARADQLKAIGVDEIACLIDYGIAREDVLAGLKPLAEVVQATRGDAEPQPDDYSIAAQILRHGVTHLQCTPSMARMIAMNDEARAALRGVRHVYLGGEPLPGALVDEFRGITRAQITNMYGPTETTIWSSAQRANTHDAVVPLGDPIANTQLYVLDDARQPVGLGEEGELWIGGEGVARGYWNRPELTAERFADNPFRAGRMYRTGDLARREPDGRLSFLGRVDHQIKLRGFRIELGEIEAALEAAAGVTQAVVMAHEKADGDVRLVGYYTGTVQSESALKAALGERLPAFMVPGRLVWLESFPLTPNKKVDRKALPVPSARAEAMPDTGVTSREGGLHAVAPAATRKAHSNRPTQPATAGQAALQAQVAAIWTRLLGVTEISGRSNFFDLGGHSLLAVQAHRALREDLGASKLAITDIFRFPVLADLAKRVAETSDPDRAVPHVAQPAPTRPAAPPAQPAELTYATQGHEPASPEPAHPRHARLSDMMQRRREMRARRGA